jgi:hypothetical protein
MSSGLKKRGTRRKRFRSNKKQHAVRAMLSDVKTLISLEMATPLMWAKVMKLINIVATKNIMMPII